MDITCSVYWMLGSYNTITYNEIDLLGRVISRTADDNSATFLWDTLKHGLLTQHSNDNVTKIFTFDSNARVATTTILVDSKSYITTNSYDGNYGRLKSMEYPNALTVGYKYNSNGYLSEEFNAQSDYNYRTITELNSFGNITQATLGDSAADINLTNNYHDVSGQMLSSSAMGNYLGARNTIHSLGYDSYDSYGNLTTASNGAINGDNIMIASEVFTYDSLHRLNTAQVTAGGTSATINYGYDAVGNFTHKSDYSANNNSAYSYVSSTNKLNQVTLKNNAIVTFGYDDKGNQTKRNNVTELTYNSFNKPLTINKNAASLTFNYGADLMRYKQQRTVGGKTITTHYIDKHYEVEIKGANTTTKAYISDVAIISDGDQVGDKSIRFTLRDRLGSATTFADHNGNGTSYRYFDPFGKPRIGDRSLLSSLGLNPRLVDNPLDIDMATRKGFTDHEHLDEVELIHMNGRVYDYNVGRFMSVDPFIQEPGNSQSINPYSYIMNNPLSGTDPTGYVSEKDAAAPTQTVTGSRLRRDIKESDTQGGQITGVGGTVKFSGTFSGGSNGADSNSGGAPKGTVETTDIKPNLTTPTSKDEKNLVGSSVITITNRDGSTTIKKINDYGADHDMEVEATINLRKGVYLKSDEFRDKLLALSKKFSGAGVDVISGYRTQAQQDELRKSNPDAAKISPHTITEAADIKIPGYSRQDVWKGAYDLNLFRRVNLYNNPVRGIHVDMKGKERLFQKQWYRKTRADYD
ncbi:MAG: DUF882 domain-containing protein [Colwellia sp.]|nr:DUF882 domain-containing protein [Colwellia sp.]